MKKYLLLICFAALFNYAHAQTAKDSVKAVINKMFAAMKNSDGKSLKECFTDSAILQTIANKNGNISIRNEAVKEFADFVNTQPKGAADEQITFDIVETSGPLATAWTPYKFYYNGQFSHCGVDSYQLVRINGEWKIQYLIDTRTKQGCD